MDAPTEHEPAGTRKPGVAAAIVSTVVRTPAARRVVETLAASMALPGRDDPDALDRLRRAVRRGVSVGAPPAARDLAARHASLTPREREVMHLVVGGQTIHEIASRLDISPHTVEIHRNHLMLKMRVTSAEELAGLAHDLPGAVE